MFKILGPDGKEFGPINADTLREWIGERKVGLETMVQIEGTTQWKPLREFPELATAFPNTPPAPRAPSLPTSPPPLPASTSPPAPPAPFPARGVSTSGRLGPTDFQRPKTSSLALATFVLGILSFCTLGLGGLVGCVMGFVAVRQIKRSGGQLRGQALAIIGLFVSILSLIVLGGAMVVIVPEINRQQYKVGASQCADNLRQVASSVRLNAEKHEGKFPAAADWCDAIGPQLGSEALLQCPRRPNVRSGYAYNRNVAGRTMSSVPPDIVLLIESDRGWNATASQDERIAPSVHGRVFCVAFADGRVQQVDVSELSTLRWEP